MEGDVLHYLPLKFSNSVKQKALVDTGACESAMPQVIYEKLKNNNLIIQLMKSPYTTVKTASGKPVNIQHQAKGNTELGTLNLNKFFFLPKMNHVNRQFVFQAL